MNKCHHCGAPVDPYWYELGVPSEITLEGEGLGTVTICRQDWSKGLWADSVGKRIKIRRGPCEWWTPEPVTVVSVDLELRWIVFNGALEGLLPPKGQDFSQFSVRGFG